VVDVNAAAGRDSCSAGKETCQSTELEWFETLAIHFLVSEARADSASSGLSYI